jgi:hypothetical protein
VRARRACYKSVYLRVDLLDDEEDPVVSPYKWSTSTTRVKQTKGGPITISTRAAAVIADTDSAANSLESEDKAGN